MQKHVKDSKLSYTKAELIEELHVGEKILEKHIKSGKIRGYKAKQTICFPPEEVDRYRDDYLMAEFPANPYI